MIKTVTYYVSFASPPKCPKQLRDISQGICLRISQRLPLDPRWRYGARAESVAGTQQSLEGAGWTETKQDQNIVGEVEPILDFQTSVLIT